MNLAISTEPEPGTVVKPQPSKYMLLAAHLNPADPDDGRRQIDQFLLDAHRQLDRERNLWRLVSKLCLIAAFACALLAAGPLISKLMIPVSDLAKLPTAMQWVATVSWSAVVMLFGGYIFLIVLQMKMMWPDHLVLAEPVGDMGAWFRERDQQPDMRHWTEAYWHTAKTNMHRRYRFGFTFWRKTLASRADYEAEFARIAAINKSSSDWRLRVIRELLQDNRGDYP